MHPTNPPNLLTKNADFLPIAWQMPHSKMLDKWQFGDIFSDDLLEWAMWLDSLPAPIPSEQAELIALLFDEEDDFLLISKAKILVLTICEKLNLVKPAYGFAYLNYGLEITEPFYQTLLPMIEAKHLSYIAQLDYGGAEIEHLSALKKTIFEQNGKIDYDTQKTWFPHEVLSLGHWSCGRYRFELSDNVNNQKYWIDVPDCELAYVLCNCLLSRNILMHNNLFDRDDLSELTVDRYLPKNLQEIIDYHVHYASRLNVILHHPIRYWAFEK